MNDLNYDNWNDFFQKINFTLFRTSLIQKKYIETVAEFAKQFHKPRILELAAGSGYTSVILADLLKNIGVQLYISDLSPELVKKVKHHFNSIPNTSFLVQDASKITLTPKHIDMIIHQGFLEHFDDETIISFLKEQKKSASTIVFDVPNSRRNQKIQEFGNERFLSPKEWCTLVERAGLKIYKCTGRRFTNTWKKYVPVAVVETDWFHRHFGESTIIACGNR